MTWTSALPNIDDSYSSKSMVRAYADALRQVEADLEAKEDHRRRARNFAQENFRWNKIASAFFDDVANSSQATSSCFTNVARAGHTGAVSRNWSFGKNEWRDARE